MSVFSNIEYRDMLYVYGFVDGNARAAVREYAERFPNRRLPSRRAFIDLYSRSGETGVFAPQRREGGRHAEENRHEAAVLAVIRSDPTTSTRRIGHRLRISHQTAHNILLRNDLYPYHMTKVEHQLYGDHAPRIEFSTWYLDHLRQWGTDRILWTDESTFTRAGIVNLHNSHVWSEENPHSMLTHHYQHNFQVNMWMGIRRGHLLGPVELPPRLNSQNFRAVLDNEILDLIGDVPLNVRRDMWFQMDGCPAHNGAVISQWMNSHFQNRWIGRNGPVRWPARSPDLTPLDFYVWGTLKTEVYSQRIESREELVERIHAGCNVMNQRHYELQRVVDSVRKRSRLCIAQQGGRFEQLL